MKTHLETNRNHPTGGRVQQKIIITKHCTVSIFHFYLYSFFPKKTHLQRIRPPNQDYYAPCAVYIHWTIKKARVFFWFRAEILPPKKSPCFPWPSLNFQGCLAALPPTAVGSPERPWRCWKWLENDIGTMHEVTQNKTIWFPPKKNDNPFKNIRQTIIIFI